ncbi:unnamed protein product [Fraxinus pennsylvanica]|uniref:Secreted protein n=1 Tax=Fraxinus pennsylvanica TaxID=56036 RepID=A0AAD2AC02_9LAMI|nr:unnamed protein product [Fraxinus pennsylvanica]
MEFCRIHILVFVPLFLFPVDNGWGIDGHLIVRQIAQPRSSKAAADALENLLPVYADNDLGSVLFLGRPCQVLPSTQCRDTAANASRCYSPLAPTMLGLVGRRFGDCLVDLVVVVTRRDGGDVGCGDGLDVFVGGVVAVVSG